MKTRVEEFMELNKDFPIYKAKRSECWAKVTYFFINNKQRTLNQNEIDLLIKEGNDPRWITQPQQKD